MIKANKSNALELNSEMMPEYVYRYARVGIRDALHFVPSASSIVLMIAAAHILSGCSPVIWFPGEKPHTIIKAKIDSSVGLFGYSIPQKNAIPRWTIVSTMQSNNRNPLHCTDLINNDSIGLIRFFDKQNEIFRSKLSVRQDQGLLCDDIHFKTNSDIHADSVTLDFGPNWKRGQWLWIYHGGGK